MPWPPLPPWSEVVDAAWRMALPAGGLTFAVPLAARWAFGRAAAEFAIPLGAAAGLALAFHLREAAPWQPDDYGSGWMHVAWAAALAGGGVAALSPSCWNWVPKLAAVAGAVWVTLSEDRRDGPWWFILLAAAMAIPWLAAPTAESDVRRQWPERSIWLALATAALSIVALHAHYLRVTDFAMMAACALAGGAAACAVWDATAANLKAWATSACPRWHCFFGTTSTARFQPRDFSVRDFLPCQ